MTGKSSGGAAADARVSAPGASLVAGLLIGVAMMAAVDEIVFHQLLAWHHFYDRSTSDIALLSDGLLHAAYLVALVAGFFLYAELRADGAFLRSYSAAGLLLGLGGFQLFDGIVDHKLLGLHEIRYEVHLLPYDLAWNGAAIVLIAVGAFQLRRARELGASRDVNTRGGRDGQ